MGTGSEPLPDLPLEFATRSYDSTISVRNYWLFLFFVPLFVFIFIFVCIVTTDQIQPTLPPLLNLPSCARTQSAYTTNNTAKNTTQSHLYPFQPKFPPPSPSTPSPLPQVQVHTRYDAHSEHCTSTLDKLSISTCPPQAPPASLRRYSPSAHYQLTQLGKRAIHILPATRPLHNWIWPTR
jgi:hypothetical protein